MRGLAEFLSQSSPGCYDDPRFRPFEQQNAKAAFEGYAEYVLKRKMLPAERKRVARIVLLVLDRMISKASGDEIRARCYPFSVAVMKALEACGVWGFMLKGSTLFTLPSGDTRSFVLEDGSPGHAWLVVPPFKIIDPTAHFQHWQDGEEAFIPKWIAAKSYKRATKDKLLEPSLLPTDSEGSYLPQHAPRFWKTFPPAEISIEQTKVYYQPYGVAIPDVPLSESEFVIGGRPAQQFLVEEILPDVAGASQSDDAITSV